MKKRVFVAVPFTEGAGQGVGKVRKMLERKRWPVKWEAPEKLHLTLAFLGWVDEERVAEVVKAAQVANEFKPMTLEFKGLGSFPDLVRPRVIWLGLKGELQQLAKLYKGVRQELKAGGFELERRPFVAHLTLGRVNREVKWKQREEMGRQVGKLRQMEMSISWRVDRVAIYESQLRRSGSVYHVVEEIKLTKRKCRYLIRNY